MAHPHKTSPQHLDPSHLYTLLCTPAVSLHLPRPSARQMAPAGPRQLPGTPQQLLSMVVGSRRITHTNTQHTGTNCCEGCRSTQADRCSRYRLAAHRNMCRQYAVHHVGANHVMYRGHSSTAHKGGCRHSCCSNSHRHPASSSPAFRPRTHPAAKGTLLLRPCPTAGRRQRQLHGWQLSSNIIHTCS